MVCGLKLAIYLCMKSKICKKISTLIQYSAHEFGEQDIFDRM